MILTSLVVISLFIVNTRAAYYFVLALVSPRELVPMPADAPQPEAARPAAAGYTVRVGPLVATVEQTTIEPHAAGPAADEADPSTATEAPQAPAPAPRPVVGGAQRSAGQDRRDHRRPRAAAHRRVHARPAPSRPSGS